VGKSLPKFLKGKKLGQQQVQAVKKKLQKAQMRPLPKAEAPQRPMGEFNLDTRPMKYFDASVDPKSMREQEREMQARSY
jgi:hypothetical protein